MKGDQLSRYLLSLAQKIMEESCTGEIINKYNQIKKSVSLKNSIYKARQKQNILTDRSKDTKLSINKSKRNLSQQNKQTNKKTKRSYSLCKFANPLSSHKDELQNRLTLQTHKKRSNTLSQINNIKQISLTNKNIIRKSSSKLDTKTKKKILSKQKENMNSNSRITKQTSIKNKQNQLHPLLNVSKSNNRDAMNSNLISKKLFGQKKVQKSSLIQNEISFNLNLHKMLSKVQRIISQQKYKFQIMSKNRKNSIISQQNLNLLKKITNKLSPFDHVNQTTDIFNTNQKDAIQIRENQKTNNSAKEVDSRRFMKQKQNKFAAYPKQGQTAKRSYVSRSQSISHENQNDTQYNNQKHASEQYRQKQKKLRNRIKQLKNDGKWMISTIDKLLEQNQQLKALLIK